MSNFSSRTTPSTANTPGQLFNQPLSQIDPEVSDAIAGELSRQRNTLEMIASENFVPRAVLQAQGSVLTNKYAEGYPGRRYYGGCENVDIIEDLARDRAKKVFGAKYANVQPHSCLLYTSPSPRDLSTSRMPSSA